MSNTQTPTPTLWPQLISEFIILRTIYSEIKVSSECRVMGEGVETCWPIDPKGRSQCVKRGEVHTHTHISTHAHAHIRYPQKKRESPPVSRHTSYIEVHNHDAYQQQSITGIVYLSQRERWRGRGAESQSAAPPVVHLSPISRQQGFLFSTPSCVPTALVKINELKPRLTMTAAKFLLLKALQ